MNNIIKLLSTIFAVGILTSCSTMQKITVKGKPNTSIYNNQYTYLGSIQSNGKAKIKIDKAYYESMLLAKEEGSKIYVPFAIDYKYHNYGIEGLIYTFVPVPIFSLLIYSVSLPEYSFKYSPYQTTNQDMAFTNYANSGERRENAEKGISGVINTNNTDNTKKSSAISSKARPRTSKAKKTLKSPAKILQGVYTGSGKLMRNNNTVENYTDMKVILTAVGNNTVKVEVFESNGESFFTSPDVYDIKKNAKGYYLSLRGIPSVFISFYNNNMVYHHPKVNIDDEIYTLHISTAK